MPGSRPGSSRQSYQGYTIYEPDYGTLPQEVYNVDQLQPNDRAMSPGRGERYGTYTPIQGRESQFMRPRSQMYRPLSRSSSRAGSRLEMGTQNWNFPRQTEAYGDDNMYRAYRSAPSPRPPPIPLERGATFAGLSDEMDPFTRQYYNRLWRSQIPSADLNLNRMGRAGGKWRHIESCIANTGSHITFVEGTVKQVDNAISGPATPCRPRLQNRPLGRIPSIKRSTKYDNKFNEHARNGFKYWPHEQKPIDLNLSYIPNRQDPKVASRLRLKARQVGLGY